MKKEDIHWADWHRILIGSAPGAFLIEVLVRTIIMYLALLVILRLMGKRMGGQLTISELAVMLTLGAIICVPMQIPDRGIFQGILVLICALVFQRGLTLIGFNSSKAEKLLQGTESMLIRNGVLQMNEIDAANISRQQLYAVLRSQQIYNLGEVERLYLEACGVFSVYKFKEPKPGLAIFPPRDHSVNDILKQENTIYICKECGNQANTNERNRKCSNCNAENWTPAILNV